MKQCISIRIKIGLVSYKTEDQSETSFTYREMLHTANRMALGLKRLGVQKKRYRFLPIAQLVGIHIALYCLPTHWCSVESINANFQRTRTFFYVKTY